MYGTQFEHGNHLIWCMMTIQALIEYIIMHTKLPDGDDLNSQYIISDNCGFQCTFDTCWIEIIQILQYV